MLRHRKRTQHLRLVRRLLQFQYLSFKQPQLMQSHLSVRRRALLSQKLNQQVKIQKRVKAPRRQQLLQILKIQIHVVVVTAAAVEVAAVAVSHRVMDQILKKVLAMSQKIQQRIQRKAQKVRHIAVAVAVVPLVKM